MAKFKDLHLLLQEEQRILFGDDALSAPTEYPAVDLGNEKPFIAYTTISGYNTTYPGMGVTSIATTDALVASVPLAGERATQEYHLVRYDQLQEAIFEEVNSDWQDSVLTFSGTPPVAPDDGDRYIVSIPGTGLWNGLDDYIVEWNTASGIWDTYDPNEGFTTFVEDEDKYYLYYNGAWAPMGEGIDHGDLKGLTDDDHIMYVPTDGSRGFTSTVSGIDPVVDSDLATKWYVDDEITTLSNTIPTDHDELNGLGDDDHLQYILVDGTRGFTGTVSGIDPTESYHLTTRWYVDDAIATATGTLTGNHSDLAGLDGDDHLQYILVDGTRGFTGTVSGIDPTESYHLTTKFYVDDAISTVSGSVITDHGELDGLGDDDHPQYILVDGSRGFTDTVSGVTPVEDYELTTKSYVDNQFDTLSGTRKWGRVSCIDGNRDQAVVFDNSFADDDYTLVATLTNEVEAKPSIYSTIQGVKTAGGFTTHFSGKIDSVNFILEWIAIYSQQS